VFPRPAGPGVERNFGHGERSHGRCAIVLGRFLQIFDGKVALKSHRLYDGVALAADRKNGMSGVDGRSSLHVVGMQGGEGNLTAALEPAHRTDVMALVAGIAVAGFGISARTFSDDGSTQTARVIKAGKPVVVTSSNTSMVR